MITDGDSSICGVMDEYSTSFHHFACQWHLRKDIKSIFLILKKCAQREFDMLYNLPSVTQKDQFEENVELLEKFFNQSSKNSAENYKKSLAYLKALYSYKEKWADSHKSLMFTAGTNTTSRAESTNSVIKRHMKRSMELCAMIELIQDLDTSHAFKDPLEGFTKTSQAQYQLDPIMVNIKEEVGELIYKKHYQQYFESKFYSITPLSEIYRYK